MWQAGRKGGLGRTNYQREYRSILSKGHLSQKALPDGSAPDGSLHPFLGTCHHWTSGYSLFICAPGY